MLHNRLAKDLLAHFSPVGPSPQTPPPTSTRHGSTAATPSLSPDPTQTPGPRLLTPNLTVLPPAPPPSPARAPLLPELLATAAHRSAAFFAEAAVLVLVLGLLDRLLARGHLELPWILGTFVTTLALLAAAILTDVSARRWLGAHE